MAMELAIVPNWRSKYFDAELLILKVGLQMELLKKPPNLGQNVKLRKPIP